MMQRNEPWLVESAITLIRNYLWALPIGKRNYRVDGFVFEFGSGASTKWFSELCNNVVSVEHDERFDQVVLGVEQFFQPRPYNQVIETFKDDYFDLILVDGRDRVKCVESSISKLKSGGWLVLDNSERVYYQKGMDLMKDWNRIDCRQNRPDKYDFIYPDWQTSIFIKP